MRTSKRLDPDMELFRILNDIKDKWGSIGIDLFTWHKLRLFQKSMGPFLFHMRRNMKVPAHLRRALNYQSEMETERMLENSVRLRTQKRLPDRFNMSPLSPKIQRFVLKL